MKDLLSIINPWSLRKQLKAEQTRNEAIIAENRKTKEENHRLLSENQQLLKRIREKDVQITELHAKLEVITLIHEGSKSRKEKRIQQRRRVNN